MGQITFACSPTVSGADITIHRTYDDLLLRAVFFGSEDLYEQAGHLTGIYIISHTRNDKEPWNQDKLVMKIHPENTKELLNIFTNFVDEKKIEDLVPSNKQHIVESPAPCQKDVALGHESQQRYQIRYFDFANGGRSWHVYDSVEKYDIHTASIGHLKEDKSMPDSCKKICRALNTMQDMVDAVKHVVSMK